MTTAAGTVQAVTYLYSAYGYATATATSGSLIQPYRWGQGYTDDPTGLIKLGLRYYDPALGRFMQQDPTGKDKYAYSYGNNCASTFNDPTGACSLDSYLHIGGGYGFAIGGTAASIPTILGGSLAFGLAVTAISGVAIGSALLIAATGYCVVSDLKD